MQDRQFPEPHSLTNFIFCVTFGYVWDMLKESLFHRVLNPASA